MILMLTLALFAIVFGRLLIKSFEEHWSAASVGTVMIALPLAVLTMLLTGIEYPALAIVVLTGIVSHIRFRTSCSGAH
ncbi:MAG: hypothetical protein K6G58_09215 [Lachnospiraceae bacterium]|nr:hypothetical protein [Lachnospiraceae bacterium]